jgi:hypothetical protein
MRKNRDKSRAAFPVSIEHSEMQPQSADDSGVLDPIEMCSLLISCFGKEAISARVTTAGVIEYHQHTGGIGGLPK